MDRESKVGLLVAFAFIAAFATQTESVNANQGASSPAESQSSTYFATLTADNVFVRSGPSVQSSYPFGKMDRGEVVRVVEENFGWARVQTAGRAFADMNGFIPVDDRAQLSVDGATITANASTELRAPNINAASTPNSSWKQIGRIEAGATLAVIDRIDDERGSVWSVRLPEMGEGWINSNFLRRSTAAEAAAFDKAVVSEEVALITAEAAAIGSSSEQFEPGAVIGEIVEVEVQPAKPTKSPERIATELRRATFADLEVAWLKIKGQPTADAEVGALYARYIVFAAESANDPSFYAHAQSRIAQLEVQQEVQNKIFELQATKARLTGECEQINDVAVAIEARSEYTAVGVLNASLIYDGVALPLLFRLQDPSTGQTVSYVVPGDGFQLSTMLGTLIGIKGEKCYDDALKLDMITPKTIDYLTSRSGG